MAPVESDCFAFGRFRLYGPDRLLVGPDGRQRLSERELQLLLYLLRHAGQVVTKDELLTNVWRAEVEESNLTAHVSILRGYLGESGRAPLLIETVSGVGYCFSGRPRKIEYEPQPGEDPIDVTDGRKKSPALTRLVEEAPARGIERIGFFNEFTEAFDELFDQATHVTTFFIHSRRWRENHHHKIVAFLKEPGHKFDVFLPEPKDQVLQATFLRNFDDGPEIPGFIVDACRYFARLAREHRGRVRLRFFRNYPVYSFYIFDERVVFACYPTTMNRRPVPTFLAPLASEIGGFVKDDVQRLARESRTPSRREINRYAAVQSSRPSGSKGTKT